MTSAIITWTAVIWQMHSSVTREHVTTVRLHATSSTCASMSSRCSRNPTFVSCYLSTVRMSKHRCSFLKWQKHIFKHKQMKHSEMLTNQSQWNILSANMFGNDSHHCIGCHSTRLVIIYRYYQWCLF